MAKIVLRTKLYSDEAYDVITAAFATQPRIIVEMVVRDVNDEVVIIRNDPNPMFNTTKKLGEMILNKLIRNVVIDDPIEINGQRFDHWTFDKRPFEDIDKYFKNIPMNNEIFRFSDDKGHPFLPISEIELLYKNYIYTSYRTFSMPSFDFKIAYAIGNLLKGNRKEVERRGFDVDKLIGKEEINPIVIQSRRNILPELFDCMMKALGEQTSVNELNEIAGQNNFEEGITVNNIMASIRFHKTTPYKTGNEWVYKNWTI